MKTIPVLLNLSSDPPGHGTTVVPTWLFVMVVIIRFVVCVEVVVSVQYWVVE